MQSVISFFFFLSIAVNLALAVLDTQQLYAQTAATKTTESETGWKVDFSNLDDEPHEQLQDRGFSFEKDMDDRNDIQLSGKKNRLEINALKPAFGLLAYHNLNLENFDTIEIEWGVNLYPEGADWDSELKREPIMICLFFGEPVDADRFYLPDSPHFLGVFLCQNNRQLEPYIGNSYQETAKYVCLGTPEPGETIRSRFNFDQAFREWFKTAETPPVTGIAIEVDTTDLPDSRSSAFIHQIRLLRTDKEVRSTAQVP